MNRRRLGKSDIEVSEISLGCWTLGGLNWVNGTPNGWANVDEEEAIRAIHLALDEGVNHFDNADVYGNGRAERMLAKALAGRSEEVVIATKVGHFPGTAAHAYEPQHIRHQCEQSLINLQRDVIDLHYFHHGNFGEGDVYLDDAAEMMHRLRDEGKIRAIGLSAYSEDDFLRLTPRIDPSAFQSWANAMDDHFIREGSPVHRLMKERGITFVAFSPVAQGLLLDKYSAKSPPQFEEGDHRRNSPRFSVENLTKLEPKMAKVRERFGGSVEELARVAIQYLLANDTVACAIPGFRNSRQVRVNLAAEGKPLSEEDVAFLREVFAD
ncbi:aldo/keto reductase [Candidatus Sumerlaeota bacterium]|nr:aldo/keto reductase [Candidatus Sumerlaeota bacterium]